MLGAYLCDKSFDNPSSTDGRSSFLPRDGSPSVIVSVFGASGRAGRAFIAAASNEGHALRLHYRSAPEDA